MPERPYTLVLQVKVDSETPLERAKVLAELRNRVTFPTFVEIDGVRYPLTELEISE